MSAAPLALMLLAAQAAGPAAPVPAEPVATPASAPAPEACKNRAEKSGDIVICAERPQGYRLNPDVMEAHRLKRSGGRLARPENFKHSDCATVGPMGCRGGPTINLIAAALTAATMAERLSNGQEIGSMFQTTPEPTEYQLYVEAKREREAKEAEKAAAAKAKAAAAVPASAAAVPAKPDSKPAESGSDAR